MSVNFTENELYTIFESLSYELEDLGGSIKHPVDPQDLVQDKHRYEQINAIVIKVSDWYEEMEKNYPDSDEDEL